MEIKRYGVDESMSPLYESEEGWLVSYKDYKLLEEEYKRVIIEHSKLVEGYVDIRSKFTMLVIKLKEMTDIIAK